MSLSTKASLTKRKVALLTGASLILMAVIAGLVMGMVYNPIFGLTPTEFSEQLEQWKPFLRWGVVGWVVILGLDVLVSWGLYRFYRDKSEKRAIAVGVLRLLYSAALAVAVWKLVMASVGASESLVIWELIMDFQASWQFGLMIFGLHLLTLSKLVCDKNWLTRAIAILLFVAGLGYTASNFMDLVITDYDSLYRARFETVFILPMVLSEVGLAVWLMVRGGKIVTPRQKPIVSVSC